MMKRFYFILLILLSVLFITPLHAQNSREAFNYLNEIGEQYENIGKEMWDYTSTMAHSRSARKLEKRRDQLIGTVKESISTVQRMNSFEGDYSFRDSVVAFLKLNYSILINDYAKIIDMEEVAEQSYDLMEAYLLAQQLANDKQEIASERMEVQYKAFADKHGINIVDSEDKISKKLRISSEVMDYYNKVYLVFFKAYKQELYLLDAMERKDLNGMEQNRNALLSVSEEGLEQLKEIKYFTGDNSLNLACRRLLTFYKDEAENKIPSLIDFYVTSQEFEEMTSLIESKNKKKLTKEEIDNYNNAIDNYNKGINTFNTTNQTLNNKRNHNLESWNNSVSNFMGRHIPKR